LIILVRQKDKARALKAYFLEQTHIMINEDFRNKATVIYIGSKLVGCPFLILESFYASQKALQKNNVFIILKNRDYRN